ncbi:MAG TPA: hypothetical protein VE933_06130, partial [Chitinophagaceae bacterium]|nr:hypothetical protein [Chitinophagaceae bacterium]
MQKLLSFILGAAVSVNMASAQSGIIQELHARSVVKNVPLRANLHLDHKLQSVHGHQGALTA